MFGLNFVGKGIALIFINFIDRVAYYLVALTYNMFLIVSRINLFDENSAGSDIYNSITRRIYTVIGIAVLFVVAYQLILNIVDPDREQGATTKMVRNAIKALILVIVFPTLFLYMGRFQEHVIIDGTIPAIILGTNGSGASADNDNAGRRIALMVYMSFYHPEGADYTTFFDENGKLRTDDVDRCKKDMTNPKDKTCQEWHDALRKYSDGDEESATAMIKGITNSGKLRDRIGDDDGNEYMWIITTACGFIVAWFFLSYTIDIAYRAVKLAFLEIVAPVPVFLRIFSKFEEKYDKWKSELIKTYIEIFFRLAIIFFIVFLCQLIPSFIGALFNTVGTNYTGLEKAFATVLLVIGMLKFGKDAPKLVQDLFSSGMFAGLNFKPGVTKRLEDTPVVGGAVSRVHGAASGALGAGINGFANSKGNRLAGLKTGLKYGAAAGFDKGGAQFGAQRQGFYEAGGGKGQAGWFGNRAFADRVVHDAKDHAKDDYLDNILPGKIQAYENSAKFNQYKEQHRDEVTRRFNDGKTQAEDALNIARTNMTNAESNFNLEQDNKAQEFENNKAARLAAMQVRYDNAKTEVERDKAEKLADLRTRFNEAQRTGNDALSNDLRDQISQISSRPVDSAEMRRIENEMKTLENSQYRRETFDRTPYQNEIDRAQTTLDSYNDDMLESMLMDEARKEMRDKSVNYDSAIKASKKRESEKETKKWLDSPEGQRIQAAYGAAQERINAKGGGNNPPGGGSTPPPPPPAGGGPS